MYEDKVPGTLSCFREGGVVGNKRKVDNEE